MSDSGCCVHILHASSMGQTSLSKMLEITHEIRLRSFDCSYFFLLQQKVVSFYADSSQFMYIGINW